MRIANHLLTLFTERGCGSTAYRQLEIILGEDEDEYHQMNVTVN